VELALGCPLIEAIAARGTVLTSPIRGIPADPVQRQLRFLGGEVAHALTHEGQLLALLILGPKALGQYGSEDLNLLAAFSQLTALALKSAERHRTIEGLNRDLQAKVEKISEQQRRILALQSQLMGQSEPAEAPAVAPVSQPGGMVGSSPMIHQLFQLVKKVSASEYAVLIRGESGTGKELLAHALHENSARAGKSFVTVHCAALSAGLLESELFGHVKGAFTGAHRDKVGRFELANCGTLFLDEIGDISIEVQIKLLRVLQEKTFERVGASEPIQVDVRIIAATHQDLEKLIAEGRFRQDLYYRLNGITIQVPPLRDRCEDIPELALHFLTVHSRRHAKAVSQIDDDALAYLKAFHWPGNIRQLENAIQRAVVVAERPTITVEELPAEIVTACNGANAAGSWHSRNTRFSLETNGIEAERDERDQRERERLVRALAEAKGNKAEAARAMGLARSTLVSRLKKHGLS
jgi:transcriptional regulator with GAF, ATPase, and Fis domain